MSTAPQPFGAELIRTMLAHAPRPADGEIVPILIALHDMVEAWSSAARPEDERPIDDLATPLYRLMAEYRPVTLAGAETLTAFILREMDRDTLAPVPRGYVAALHSALRALHQQEAARHHRDGIPLLHLDSACIPGADA